MGFFSSLNFEYIKQMHLKTFLDLVICTKSVNVQRQRRGDVHLQRRATDPEINSHENMFEIFPFYLLSLIKAF